MISDIITNKRLLEFLNTLKSDTIKVPLTSYIVDQIKYKERYNYTDLIRDVEVITPLEKIFSPKDFYLLKQEIDIFNEVINFRR